MAYTTKEILELIKEKGIKIAIGSSSKNTPIILRQIGLSNYFDAVSDGGSGADLHGRY